MRRFVQRAQRRVPFGANSSVCKTCCLGTGWGASDSHGKVEDLGEANWRGLSGEITDRMRGFEGGADSQGRSFV